MAWEWLAPSAVAIGAGTSFLGARFGARSALKASREATRQREDQTRREEWGRRFASALDRVGTDDPEQRRIAFTMLGHLAKDEHATVGVKDLARKNLESVIVTPSTRLRGNVADSDVVVDDGPCETEEGGQP